MSLEKLDSHLIRGIPSKFHCLNRNGTAGIVKSHDSMEFWIDLFQNFQVFPGEIANPKMDARQPTSGMGKTLHKSERHGIISGVEDDRGIDRCQLYRLGDGGREGVNQINLFLFKLFCRFLDGLEITSRIPDL